MLSFKSKIPLFTIIILLLLVIFFTLWDIIYDEQFIQLFDFISDRQMLVRLIILYCILTIFIIIVVFSQTKKKYDSISRTRRIYEKIIGHKYYQFKCPKCKEIITIKKLKNNANSSLITSCPSCGTIGRIPLPKTSEIKFECNNCGEQVTLWTSRTNISHEVKLYSCPYCGKRQTMNNI